nr:hypothetical protein [Streptomyces sp. ODS25]
MGLVDLIAIADERALAATGVACLDRCLPVLGGADEALRPLWSSLTDGTGWSDRLAAARTALKDAGTRVATPGKQDPEDEARAFALRMLAYAPDTLPPGLSAPAGSAERRALHRWADVCSLAALHVHNLLDATGETPDAVAARRSGRLDGVSPLVQGELRRQTEILELLAEHGSGALRQALELSTDGRRILRAAVSRRARAR